MACNNTCHRHRFPSPAIPGSISGTIFSEKFLHSCDCGFFRLNLFVTDMRPYAAIFTLLLSGLFTVVTAQGEVDDQERIFFRNEKTYAATLGTNGFAGNFRFAKRLDARRKTLYEIGFAYIKHEKEYKISYSSSQSLGGSYVFGKTNSLFTLRMGIGFQKELFRKEDKGGISVRYFYNFGPSLGFQKPVYYDVWVNDESSGGNTVVRRRMKFEPHILAVDRKAPFYVGVSETTLVPGIYGKFGFTFEFSKADEVFNAIEVGIIVDTYIKKVPIMANEHNHFIFPAGYVSYRFGKVINAQFSGRDRNQIDDMLTE